MNITQDNEITPIYHMPRWEELPDIDLYIDQVTSLVNKYFRDSFGDIDIEPLTKSMVNNYVKAKIVDPPVNKKYPRVSVAMIIVVYLIKTCYQTQDARKLIQLGLGLYGIPETFDRFCEDMERAMNQVFSGKIHVEDEKLEARKNKYMMENMALTFATKAYVQKNFIHAYNEEEILKAQEELKEREERGK